MRVRAATHDLGVIRRDLKAENILIAPAAAPRSRLRHRQAPRRGRHHRAGRRRRHVSRLRLMARIFVSDRSA
jgi:hypothetical protein